MPRRAAIAALLMAVGALVWYLSDRPALQINVERGGHAFVKTLWSKTALPETIQVHQVGSHTVIRISNADSVRHVLGLFEVGPGETRDFVIAYAGTFGGFCSTHPASKELVYVVE